MHALTAPALPILGGPAGAAAGGSAAAACEAAVATQKGDIKSQERCLWLLLMALPLLLGLAQAGACCQLCDALPGLLLGAQGTDLSSMPSVTMLFR